MRKLLGMVGRLGKEMLYLSWTLAGTGLVLITLSSSTLKQGIYISIAGLALHLMGTAIDYFYDEGNDEADK